MRIRSLVLTVLAIAIVLPLAGRAQDPPAGDTTEPATFRIDNASSWLRVLVYRGGLLRGFGHNHVISHHNLTGTATVPEDPLRSAVTLEFVVADLVVDDRELRALEGADFGGQVSQKDIAGTRANMLGKKLLQAAEFPLVQVRTGRITGSMPDLQVEASVNVRGREFTMVFPASVILSNDSFVASGEVEIRHAAIGLSPFKAALGTLKVRDTLVLKYEISGVRITPSA